MGKTVKNSTIAKRLGTISFDDCKGRAWRKSRVRQTGEERFLVRFGDTDLIYEGHTQPEDSRLDQNSANLKPR